MIDLLRLSLLCVAGLCLAYVGYAVGRQRERADHAVRNAGRLLARRVYR